MSFGSDELKCCDGYVYRGLRVGRLFVVPAREGGTVRNGMTGTMESQSQSWLVMDDGGYWCAARVATLADALCIADDIMLFVGEHVREAFAQPDNAEFVKWIHRMVLFGRYEPFPGSRIRTEAA